MLSYTFYYSPMPYIVIQNVCCSPNPFQERSFLPKRAAIKKIVAEGDLYYSPMPFIAILNVCCSPNPHQERTCCWVPMDAHRLLVLYCSLKRFTALLCVLPLSQSAWIRVSSQKVAPNFFEVDIQALYCSPKRFTTLPRLLLLS